MGDIRIVVLCSLAIGCAVMSFGQPGFTLNELPARKKVEVLFNGKLVTSYCYFDSVEKPILFPVRTLSGVTVTRGYPVAPRAGERTDHPHHAGIWFNYEHVNGLDFWNNSDAIPISRKSHYGSIAHQTILSRSADRSSASLVTLSHWVDQKGNVLLFERTDYTFSVKGADFIIDRKCELKAVTDTVVFRDVKDGLLGIRVARSLEMPSTQKDKFVDSRGNQTSVPAMNNDGVTGMYINRQGIKGDEVWSSQSEWAQLSGEVRGKKVSIIIIDHPSNPGYPTYWHARGYGLFAANPLGRGVFSKGKENLNLTLNRGETAEFRYRIVIHEGDALSNKEIDLTMKDFQMP